MSVNINNTGLLYYYPFDTDLLDYSSGTGVANGSASSVGISAGTTRITSGSLYIPGASGGYFQLPNTTFGSTGLTISFWMNIKSISASQFLFYFGAGATSFGLALSGGTIRLVKNGTNVNFGYDLPTGWNHFCFTVSNSGGFNFGQYLNSVFNNADLGRGFTYAYPTTLLNNCYIGQAGSTPLTACCNQFTVFNRVLTSTEIAYLYKYPKQVVFSSSPTTTSLPADSYVISTISATTNNIQYSSLNLVSGSTYSLKTAGGSLMTTNAFASLHPATNARTTTIGYGGLASIAMDGDGNTYYVRQSAILVYNSRWQLVKIVTTPESYLNFGMDVSNNKLYCAGLSTLGVLNLTTLVLTTFTAPTSGLTAVAIGPDGYLYGTARYVTAIRRINPANGTYTTIFTTTAFNIFYGCDFDSNGFLYCITGYDAFGYIYKFDTSGNNYGLLATSNVTNVVTLCCNKIQNVLYTSAGGKIIAIPTSTGLVTNFTNVAMTGLFHDPYTNYLYGVDGNGGSYAGYVYPVVASDYSMNFKFPVTYLTPGANLLQLYNQSNVAFGIQMIIDITCFLEGTLIKCLSENMFDDVYIPVEKLTKDTYVKTLSSGYVQVHSIGFMEIYNPSEETEIDNRLFKYKKGDERMPELFQDLYITGNHAALVETFSQEEYDRVVKHMGAVYETEKKLRMPACLDPRAEPFVEPGTCKIWHFALQNPDIYTNYGVYANGLLVESSSIRYLTELSNMELKN